MVHTVYILYSTKDKKLYVGCTTSIDARLKMHRYGHVQSTRLRRPLVLIHTEQYENAAESFQRERFLKSLWGGEKRKRYFVHT